MKVWPYFYPQSLMNLDSLLATLVPFYMFISLIEGFANVIIINAIKKIKPEMVELSKNGC